MSDKEIEIHRDRCQRLLNNEEYETCHFAPAEIQNFLNLIEQLQQRIDKAMEYIKTHGNLYGTDERLFKIAEILGGNRDEKN